jgi:hypothetical protein
MLRFLEAEFTPPPLRLRASDSLQVAHRTLQPRFKIREYNQCFPPDLDGLISIWFKLTGADLNVSCCDNLRGYVWTMHI